MRMCLQNGSGHVLLPSAPFLAWLESLVARTAREYPYVQPGPTDRRTDLSPEARVAARCGMTLEALRNLRRRQWETVRESTVDRACTNEGSIHISELYPEYWAIANAGGPKQYLEQLATA